MKEVWILYKRTDDGTMEEIVGVFASKEKALERMAAIHDHDWMSESYYDVEFHAYVSLWIRGPYEVEE